MPYIQLMNNKVDGEMEGILKASSLSWLDTKVGIWKKRGLVPYGRIFKISHSRSRNSVGVV